MPVESIRMHNLDVSICSFQSIIERLAQNDYSNSVFQTLPNVNESVSR